MGCWIVLLSRVGRACAPDVAYLRENEGWVLGLGLLSFE